MSQPKGPKPLHPSLARDFCEQTGEPLSALEAQGNGFIESRYNKSTPRSFSSGSEICEIPPHWERRKATKEYRKNFPSKSRIEHEIQKGVANFMPRDSDTESVTSTLMSSRCQGCCCEEGNSDKTLRQFDALADSVRSTSSNPINEYILGQIQCLKKLYKGQKSILSFGGTTPREDRFAQTKQAKIYRRDLMTPSEQKQEELSAQNKEIIKRLDALNLGRATNRRWRSASQDM